MRCLNSMMDLLRLVEMLRQKLDASVGVCGNHYSVSLDVHSGA